MSNYIVNIPKPSAKRLEKDRKLVIRFCGFEYSERKLDIPDGLSSFSFEFNEPLENFEPNMLDADFHYLFCVEFSNSTGTRIERVEVTPQLQI